MNKNIVVAAALCALSGGCATVDPQVAALAAQTYRDSIPTCNSAKECEVKWAAARNWMLSNCGFRLQTVQPDYLETYKSGDSADTGLYCRVVKTPYSETGYRIELTAGANNFLMYSAHSLTEVKQRFNDAVNAAWRPTAATSY